MKNKECDIIRDLLPNYMDNLTSKDTNAYIEDHINGCSECSTILKNMQMDYNVKKEDKKTKEFVDFAKKYKRKFRSLKFLVIFSILFIILIFIVSITRKYMILSSSNEKLHNVFKLNNYYYRHDLYLEDNITTTEFYKKDDKYMIVHSFYNKITHEVNYPRDVLTYYDGQDTYFYVEETKEGEEKVKYYFKENSNYYEGILKRQETKTSDILLASLFSKIDTETINGKECYRIVPSDILNEDNYYAGNINYINKKTGIPMRSISQSDLDKYTAIFEETIELDSVTDDDFVIPNVEEYKPFEEIEEKISQDMVELEGNNEKE